jgi:filamentous hemagglutinin
MAGGDDTRAPDRPPSLSPPGAGRRGAFHAAKRKSGIPVSQQPDRVVPNVDRRGNVQPGKVYEFEVPAPGGGKRTVRIRDDAAGHDFGPGDPQNRGPHFNDEAGNHYDY